MVQAEAGDRTRDGTHAGGARPAANGGAEAGEDGGLRDEDILGCMQPEKIWHRVRKHAARGAVSGGWSSTIWEILACTGTETSATPKTGNFITTDFLLSMGQLMPYLWPPTMLSRHQIQPLVSPLMQAQNVQARFDAQNSERSAGGA